MQDLVPIRHALLSVFDKTGLEPLARALHAHQVVLYSTGGTYKYLTETLKLPARKVDSLTDFPEMMDGRVKTLHPKVFGGILARRDNNQDLKDAESQGIPLFDLIVVNLYNFASTLGKPREEQIRLIDIGGPAMLRAASKNHEAVTVLSDPSDYAAFLEQFEKTGGNTDCAFRFSQAVSTFERTSKYDAMIVQEWRAREGFPEVLPLVPQTPLRYGENPHQKAAWAGTPGMWQVIQGKELSYNNLLDTEAATRLAGEFSEPALSIVKHNSPCGVASGELSTADLFARAFEADSKSAFGGIVACNREIDGQSAHAMAEIFLEVVAAPSFTPEALDIFSHKKNLRLVAYPKMATSPFEVRTALGGWLIQDTDKALAPELRCVTQTPLDASMERDLRFAWKVVKHVRSNAIVIAKMGVNLGMGGGQTNRVDAVAIALSKTSAANRQGAVLASDAFFPFRDNIDLLKESGIRAIIQPGGSKRDAEVIQACDELGIAMAFTGARHFRH